MGRWLGEGSGWMTNPCFSSGRFPKCHNTGTVGLNELPKGLRAWKGRLSCWKSEKILATWGWGGVLWGKLSRFTEFLVGIFRLFIVFIMFIIIYNFLIIYRILFGEYVHLVYFS